MRGWLYRWLAAAMGIALGAGALIELDLLSFVQRPVSDTIVRMAAQMRSPALPLPDAAVIAIDAQSMRAFGDAWPWPRARFAQAIERLDAAGARAIAFDIDFSTARDAGDDLVLARAIERSGRVVLSAHREIQDIPGVGELEVASVPAPRLAQGAAAVGAALVEIDVDGVIRNAFRTRSIGGERLPSLSEAALAVALGRAPDRADARAFPIDYRRSEPPVPVIPFIDVVEGRFDPARVAGRVVLIGATAVEFQDLWATPLGPNRPGVVIQALVVRTLAARRAQVPVLAQPGKRAQLAIALLVSLVAGVIGAAPAARRRLGLALLGAGVPLAALGLTVRYGVLLDPLAPLGVVAAHYALGLEAVRRRLGQRLAERELSLSTLFSVGEATSGPSAAHGLDLALALLGDVVSASGVALLRTNANGELDSERLEWRRRGERPVGDIDTATVVLADRQTRVFEGAIPGRDGRGGLAVYTPLFAGPSPVGVLVVEQEFARPLTDMQLRTIATVGTQLALSVENLRLYSSLQYTFRSSITALASAVEARDGYTDMHCRRLAVFSVIMAERLGLPPEEVEAIELGALLHDVGKIGIRDDILLKEDRLTPGERTEIERHAAIGHRIVEPINGISSTTLGCVRHHHERWNGTGYPDGLAGEDIPLGARIVAIVDVWDALSTDRPYKRAYPQQRVQDIIKKDSGVRFEPALVDLFLEILEERGDELLHLIEATNPDRGEA